MEEADLWSRRDDLVRAVGRAAGLVVRNQTGVDRELLAVAPLLRVVGRLGAGLDNVDAGALRERAIDLVHGGGLNARAVAEYVLGAALVLARRLAESDRHPGCRAIDPQYLLGPDLLVCPVFSESPDPVDVDLYLPAGTAWVDWWTGRTERGGRWLRATVPLERLPLGRRAGAVIETGPVVQHTGELPDGVGQ